MYTRINQRNVKVFSNKGCKMKFFLNFYFEGKYILISVPLPTSERISKSPLCCVIMCLTIANPKPVPPTFLLCSMSTL